MNEKIKNWDIARLIRLMIGVGFAIFGFFSGDYFIVMMGVLLAVMALLSTSCCAAGGCGNSTGSKAAYKKFVEPYRLNESRNNKK